MDGRPKPPAHKLPPWREVSVNGVGTALYWASLAVALPHVRARWSPISVIHNSQRRSGRDGRSWPGMDRNAPDEQLSITTAHIVLGKEHIDCQRELVSLLEQGKDASTAMKKAAVAATFAILVGVSYASVAAAAEDNLPDEAAIPCRSVLTVNDGKIPARVYKD